MIITGTSVAIDNTFRGVVVEESLRTGASNVIDSRSYAPTDSIAISSTEISSSDSTFLQGEKLRQNDLSLTLRDSTFTGGTLVDGTYMDSTYVKRVYNPLQVSYSIWSTNTPDSSNYTLQGIRERLPLNASVGNFYSNMTTPEVSGEYKIQWVWQKLKDSLAQAEDVTFVVKSRGIDAQSDNTKKRRV